MEFSLRLSSSLMFVPAVIHENALVTIVSTRVFLEYCESAKGLSGSSTDSARQTFPRLVLSLLSSGETRLLQR